MSGNKYMSLIIIFIITLLLETNSEPPARLIIGTQNQKINIASDCDQTEILTNYKHIQIRITNLINIEKVLITDKIITDCNSKECAADSNICQSRTVDSNSQIIFDTKMCVGAIYINAIRSSNSDPNAEYSYQISTEYISWGSCSYIHENAFAFCGESNLNDCRTCKRQGCTIVECGNDVKSGKQDSFVSSYEVCVPYTISDKEKLATCTNFNGVTTYRSSGICEFDDLDGYSSSTVFLIGIIAIVVLIFGLAVIYYNISLYMNKTAPFEPPSFLPEMLFPRSTNEGKLSIDRNLENLFISEKNNKQLGRHSNF